MPTLVVSGLMLAVVETDTETESRPWGQMDSMMKKNTAFGIFTLPHCMGHCCDDSCMGHSSYYT